MAKKRLVKVVKYGGSLFTRKDLRPVDLQDILERHDRYVREDTIGRAAEETRNAIEELEKREIRLELWLGHGVGQYGHDAVGFLGVTPEVRRYCEFLNSLVVDAFKVAGVPAETLNLASTSSWDGRRFTTEFMGVGRGILKEDRVPMAFGTVVKAPLGYKIVSCDDYVVMAAESIGASQALMFIDVEVSDKDPKKHKDAKPVDVLKSSSEISVTRNDRDRTGSILEKIEKMGRIASKGIESRIVNGEEEGNIRRALMGERVGTLIRP